VLLEVEVEVLEDEVDALVVVHDVLQPARQRERISSG
jgi:predicted solute-binding protein